MDLFHLIEERNVSMTKLVLCSDTVDLFICSNILAENKAEIIKMECKAVKYAKLLRNVNQGSISSPDLASDISVIYVAGCPFNILRSKNHRAVHTSLQSFITSEMAVKWREHSV